MGYPNAPPLEERPHLIEHVLNRSRAGLRQADMNNEGRVMPGTLLKRCTRTPDCPVSPTAPRLAPLAAKVCGGE